MAAVGVAALVPLLPEEGYQARRLAAWLKPEEYALTEGFQTMRALRSIGSGQWSGKGFGSGEQNQLGWLPEQHTDMIFAVIGEETGLIGCTVILLLFACFVGAGLYSAGRTPNPFARMVLVGFTCLLAGQVIINLAVVLGLMPVTGITLPLFSYGGSSLLGTWIGLGLCAVAASAPHRHFGSQNYQRLKELTMDLSSLMSVIWPPTRSDQSKRS